MEFLLLFGFKLLLYSGLERLLMMHLPSYEVGRGSFEVLSDLFRQVLMITSLLVRLQAQCVQ